MQVFHTALEVVCDGLHVLIDDPYGPKIGVQYRKPKSNEYHQVSLTNAVVKAPSCSLNVLLGALTSDPSAANCVQAELNLDYDMYEAQFADFLHAVRTGDRSGIRSLYHDAVRTYETSRWITDASIKTFKA